MIEDAAHAHGAEWRGKGVGLWGDFGSFSLQSAKSLTTGEGGVLLIKDPHLAQRAASIIDCGRPKDPEGVEFTMGQNYRWSSCMPPWGWLPWNASPSSLKNVLLWRITSKKASATCPVSPCSSGTCATPVAASTAMFSN